MFIGSCIVTFRAEWVASLKEKRMIVKSLIAKSRNKFNISVAEVDMQDVHQVIVIGFSAVSNSKSHLDDITENVIAFFENNTDAVITDIEKEIL
ncbi:MAG: DUF503 domain-containing protein [Firmicutes bacterium]|nr:DUF503 domain-containing protein [Bacillota bacterium]